MNKYYKLAQIIRAAGKEISRKGNYNKYYSVDGLLGHIKSDAHPEILEVEDDSGYRSIIIGDTRGNVSYDTDRHDDSLFHNGYAYLYSEQCSYNDEGKEIWSKRCYPSVDHLYRALLTLAKGDYDYKEGRFFSLDLDDNNDFEKTRAYLSGVVEKFADLAASDSRTAADMLGEA